MDKEHVQQGANDKRGPGKAGPDEENQEKRHLRRQLEIDFTLRQSSANKISKYTEVKAVHNRKKSATGCGLPSLTSQKDAGQ
jgi:hypothetical protein